MSYKFFCNKECEFFPCHKAIDRVEFNCLFCYCPLYLLDDKCGGNFKYLPNGIKDCSDCTIPHIKDKGYEHVQKKMKEVMEIAKRE